MPVAHLNRTTLAIRRSERHQATMTKRQSMMVTPEMLSAAVYKPGESAASSPVEETPPVTPGMEMTLPFRLAPAAISIVDVGEAKAKEEHIVEDVGHAVKGIETDAVTTDKVHGEPAIINIPGTPIDVVRHVAADGGAFFIVPDKYVWAVSATLELEAERDGMQERVWSLQRQLKEAGAREVTLADKLAREGEKMVRLKDTTEKAKQQATALERMYRTAIAEQQRLEQENDDIRRASNLAAYPPQEDMEDEDMEDDLYAGIPTENGLIWFPPLQ